MPEIEITEDQRERLEDIKSELAADVVGKYGVVRTRDALEYLLDRYEADGGVDGEVVESHVDESGETADDGEADDGDAEGGEDGDGSEADDDGDGSEADDDGDGSEAASDDGDAEAASDDGDAEGDDEETGDAAADGGASRLNAMMSLLETHSEKWDEGSGEERYVVDLPDGGQEAVRTKDDVRALLFKHYR